MATGSQSARATQNNSRPASGVMDRSGFLTAREGRRAGQDVPVVLNKENLFSSPAPPPKQMAAFKKADDTPTKGLTRSPKPLTLLEANVAENDAKPSEARRSSPGLFKVAAPQPVGAAHAAARANRIPNTENELAAFRERMRGTQPNASAKNDNAVIKVEVPRPSSARGRRANGDWGASPRNAIVPAPPPSARQPRNNVAPAPPAARPPSRTNAPAARAPLAAQNPNQMQQPMNAPRKGGADFRSRKYANAGNANAGSRINALISPR